MRAMQGMTMCFQPWAKMRSNQSQYRKSSMKRSGPDFALNLHTLFNVLIFVSVVQALSRNGETPPAYERFLNETEAISKAAVPPLDSVGAGMGMGNGVVSMFRQHAPRRLCQQLPYQHHQVNIQNRHAF